MADRIITNSERGMTVTVNDIEHIESQSVQGVGVIKIFFQPQANIQTALAQVTAIVQTTVRSLPPGTTPPLVITYTASSTPIVQLGISSKTMPEQVLFDLGQNFIRTQLADRSGRGHAVSVWRQDAPGASRSRHAPAAIPGSVTQRYCERG